MIVGPNHPMFTRPRPGHNGIGPSPVPGIPNVPPGARFDPVGPFGPNPNFPFGPARPRGNPFSGDPDNDHETFRGDFYS